MKVILLLFFLFSTISFAKDEKKVYSEEEFEKKLTDMVETEVEKRLIRSGRKKIVEFSQELFEKEKEIEKKELLIKKKEEALVIQLKHFEERTRGLLEDQNKILGCIDDHQKKQNNRAQHMVQVISGMKPNNAAQVLSVQDADITVKILGMLEPTKVSKIFNLMDKEISARLQKQYMTMKK